MIALTRELIDESELLRNVKSPHAGAVCLFLGTVRDLTGDEVTVFLDYEAYPAMAEAKLAEIEAELRRRWPVENVAIVHRLGRLAVGEASVAVAVSSPHRVHAFEACRYAIDTVKELVPIWKKDVADSGREQWKHPEPIARPTP
ncbi:MAG: molybdenum cofactor biosynthesis protein MoaE [Gemmataceae bacterium]